MYGLSDGATLSADTIEDISSALVQQTLSGACDVTHSEDHDDMPSKAERKHASVLYEWTYFTSIHQYNTLWCGWRSVLYECSIRISPVYTSTHQYTPVYTSIHQYNTLWLTLPQTSLYQHCRSMAFLWEIPFKRKHYYYHCYILYITIFISSTLPFLYPLHYGT